MDELRIRQCGSGYEYCGGIWHGLRLNCLTCAYAGRPTYDWPCTVCRPTEYGGTMHLEKE